MFYEDEKDVLGNIENLNISEDGVVEWPNDNDEDLVSLKNVDNKLKNDSKVINLGDELELVSDSDDDIDNDELLKVLNGTTEENNIAEQANTTSEEDFDIDKQLAEVSLDQNSGSKAGFTPRKEEGKKSGINASVILIALVFAAAIAGGVYFFTEYTNKQGVNNEELLPTMPSQPKNLENQNQEEENIANKPQENIPVVGEDNLDNVKP